MDFADLVANICRLWAQGKPAYATELAELKLAARRAPPEELISAVEVLAEHGNDRLVVPAAPQQGVPPDKACARCGAYTTTRFCSSRCANAA